MKMYWGSFSYSSLWKNLQSPGVISALDVYSILCKTTSPQAVGGRNWGQDFFFLALRQS